MNQKKIVITGGPSTGKTAVIQKLEKLGFACFHEVIRSMTLVEKKQNKDVSFSSNPIVSVNDPIAFNLKLLKERERQFDLARELEDRLVFFDRGLPDVLAYMDCFGQQYDETFLVPCRRTVYDQVFLMPPWKDIFKTDNERFESYTESERIFECLKNTYERLGYLIHIVPKASIDQRIDLILNHLKHE
ncbi:MAG: ATP-binding protein [Bacteroidota bacterium]